MIKKILINNFSIKIYLALFIFNSCDNGVDPPQNNEFITEAEVFLEKNRFDFNLSYDDPISNVPDSIFDNTQIILTGESHGIKQNSQIQLHFIKYLNKEYGVKNLILEIGYSQSLNINNYLSTGDIEILDDIFRYTKGTFFWTKENYSFYQNLYELNQSLPEGTEIECIGVDVEHQFMYAFNYLNSLFSSKSIPKDYSKIVNEVSKFVNENLYDRFKADSLAQEISDKIETEKESAAAFLGMDLYNTKQTLSGIIKLFEWSNSSSNGGQSDDNIRDEFMFDSFSRIASLKNDQKFYGHFGNSHIMQSMLNGVNSFAERLNSDPLYTDKVLSIYCIYSNSFSLTIDNKGNYGNAPTSGIRPPFEFLAESSPFDHSFFKLEGNNSPFSDYKYLDFYRTESGLNHVITDYFQNIILIKNGGASEALQ